MPHLPRKDKRRVYPCGPKLHKSETTGSRAGKFAGAVGLFYREFTGQGIEKKDVKIGLELANIPGVGEASRGSL
jgi:hypothetical protein